MLSVYRAGGNYKSQYDERDLLKISRKQKWDLCRVVWHASETPKHHSRKSYQIGITIKNFQNLKLSLLICDVLNSRLDYDA